MQSGARNNGGARLFRVPPYRNSSSCPEHAYPKVCEKHDFLREAQAHAQIRYNLRHVQRHQSNKENILHGIFKEDDFFDACMCNPPFYSSKLDAAEANNRKLKGLGIKNDGRNFSGNANELWYEGGEKAFLHNYLYQSSTYKKQCYWFTSLVSKKENVESMYDSLNKLDATEITFPFFIGTPHGASNILPTNCL